VIRALDPAHDRQTQLVASGPGPSIEDVLLQQGEERFHRGIVAGRAYLAHRAEQPVTGQGTHELP